MKIVLLFDGASALGASADVLILETIEAIEHVLVADGHQVVRLPVYADGRWIERVRRGKYDLAFNLCEGINGVAALEPSVISVLELFGLPYTGSSSATTTLCLRKDVVNAMLDKLDLPIPRWSVVRPRDRLPTVGFPAICKPVAEDASIGVEQASVVRTQRQLASRIEAMQERWDEILVQRYIDGREVNVGIVGDKVLPIAEIRFDRMPKGMWRIVSYRSKWETGCDEDLGAAPRCPAPLPKRLTEEIQHIALAAWNAVGGEGYGRVDLRIDRAGRPWILEVNANPDIAPDAGLARMAGVAGMDFGAMIRHVCECAMARRSNVSPDESWIIARRLSGVTLSGDAAALDLFRMARQ
ncbi:MAG TPA: hypothetical protein VJ672_05935 [Gemmatimonadaceae bacterium]|nr:hypothetical protein [Gemmatimonadaceae bacterium]